MSTLCHAFAHTVSRIPDRIALRSLGGERELTWADYATDVSSLAAMLIELGIRSGDSVAVMMSTASSSSLRLFQPPRRHACGLSWISVT